MDIVEMDLSLYSKVPSSLVGEGGTPRKRRAEED
jgi:hypothetical protein